jgi:hypothetical protein
VVHEYPDVFPNNLSGMPPDRAIKFKIELQPDTNLVYKRPYLMALNELAEIKGISNPPIHHGVILLSL